MSTREEIEAQLKPIGEAAVKKFREANGMARTEDTDTISHTKGPWVWLEHDSEYSSLVHYTGDKFPNGEPQYVTIADDGSAGGEYSQSINPKGPDGILIAAAPDLLEALENILYDNPGCMCANCEQGREAVKKAKGDSE